eukprot:CAMPEP_0179080932 /NCGR_PEP_ID=MMETSP0796-20121207/36405_1 /TAXON_ID=73915 /ORGANISM="Pyrodinium bahamense, Strain pbaha01" /LENGTH=415 /DNA_ID=CAMNT_0020778299 /DNA_START=6 /DNA_END=1254 /DNA_ORIENTATION=-
MHAPGGANKPAVARAAPSPQPSEALRAGFARHVEAWLCDLQGLINAEVDKCRAELMHEAAVLRQQLDAEWARVLSERESLQQEKDALVVREEALEREKATLQGCRSPADVLDLNVGGQAFCTVKRSTLCLVENSALNSMFSGRWEGSLERDSAGRIFVDFPPEIFMPLVDYLRQKSIEDPADPVEPPDVPAERLPPFKRMLTYYGLVDTIWPRPEGKWQLAWGHIQISDEDRVITVNAQRDTYQAAAINVMRLWRSSHFVWQLHVSKTRNETPWYYDSVAFGLVHSPDSSSSCLATERQPSANDLMMNLRGDMTEDFPNASIDLGGMPAEQTGLDVEVRVRNRRFAIFFNGREHASVAVPPRLSEASSALLVAVTYPWIQVQLALDCSISLPSARALARLPQWGCSEAAQAVFQT